MLGCLCLFGILGGAVAEYTAPVEEIACWSSIQKTPNTLLIIIPGMDPDWWGQNADPTRDHFIRALPSITPFDTTESSLSPKLRALAERVPVPPDTLLALWENEFVQNGEGIILCGLSMDPPSVPGDPICLWISQELREIAGLSEGRPRRDLIRPERINDEIHQTGGISRILRAEEAREILALPSSGLQAFQNLPSVLPDHPMSLLKRVFLGDKLFVNLSLYTMSVCDWRKGAIRFGLVQAYREVISQFQKSIDDDDAESMEFLQMMYDSGTLIADRIDRLLFSLWNEIPSGGSLWLLGGDNDSTWLIKREKK